jgi:hypothetical protein
MKFGAGEQFANAATLLTYYSSEKKNHFDKINVNLIATVFKLFSK